MAVPLKLDWSQAAVKDGTLSVSLSGRPPKRWRASFETAAVLLSHDRLSVSLSKGGAIKVSQVQTGDEDSVREFVEGCVLQANATIADEDELFDTGGEEGDDAQESGDDGGEDAQPSHDEQLTGRFQAFAEGDAG
jgi:hypothetical protein